MQIKEEEMSQIEKKLWLKNYILAGSSQDENKRKKIKKNLIKRATVIRKNQNREDNHDVKETMIP